MSRRVLWQARLTCLILLGATLCLASIDLLSDTQAHLEDASGPDNATAPDTPPAASPHVKLDLDDLSGFHFDYGQLMSEFMTAQKKLFRQRSVRSTQTGCEMLERLAANLDLVMARIPKARKMWPGVSAEDGDDDDDDDDAEDAEDDDTETNVGAPHAAAATGAQQAAGHLPEGQNDPQQHAINHNWKSQVNIVTESSIMTDPNNPELALSASNPSTATAAAAGGSGLAPAQQLLQQRHSVHGTPEVVGNGGLPAASRATPGGRSVAGLERDGPDFVQQDPVPDSGPRGAISQHPPAEQVQASAPAAGGPPPGGSGGEPTGAEDIAQGVGEGSQLADSAPDAADRAEEAAEHGAAASDAGAEADAAPVAAEGTTVAAEGTTMAGAAAGGGGAGNSTTGAAAAAQDTVNGNMTGVAGAAAAGDAGNSSTAAAAAAQDTANGNMTGVAWLQVGEYTVITGLEVAAAALFDLAVLATSGVAEPHIKRDPLWAHLALHKAAAFNSVEAQLALADRYFFGRGTPEDCEAGLRYARLAANYMIIETDKDNSHIDPFAPVRLRERWMRADYVTEEELRNDRALVAMEEDLALRGDAGAQRRVAYRRLVGQGVRVDEAAAFNHFQAAAAQGDPYALFNLGYMHLQGLHVPANSSKARHYFEVAASKKLGAAYNGLGVLYFNGQGVERNLTTALQYFEAGAKLNNSDCLFNLATLFHTVEVNVTKALEYLKLAHELGHWRAGYNLAMLYYEPGNLLVRGCEDARDYLLQFVGGKKAWQLEMKWAAKAYDLGDHWGALVRYIRMAEQGCEEAAANAAWILLQDRAMRWSGALPLAVRQLKRSASYNTTGSCGSLVQLGNICLEVGQKLEPRPCGATDAAAHYRRAAEGGCVEAMLSLGWMYWQGRGVDANVSEAWVWYHRAYKNSTVVSDGWGPSVALWGFRAVHAASLVVGWGALRAVGALLVACHRGATRGLLLGLEAASEFAEGRLKVAEPQTVQADMDLVVITFLLAALMAVLWLRRQVQQRGVEADAIDPTNAPPSHDDNEGRAPAAPAAPPQPAAPQPAAPAGAQHIPPEIQPGAGGVGGGQG